MPADPGSVRALRATLKKLELELAEERKKAEHLSNAVVSCIVALESCRHAVVRNREHHDYLSRAIRRSLFAMKNRAVAPIIAIPQDFAVTLESAVENLRFPHKPDADEIEARFQLADKLATVARDLSQIQFPPTKES
jgi:hypothetical protein